MKKYWIVYVCSFFCVLWLLPGCNRSGNKEATNETAEVQRITEVKIAEAQTGRIVNGISTTGTVFARREARIRPKISGRIEAILVEVGDRVEKDQVLVRLEQEDFLLAKHRAEAAFGTANAALQQLLAGARGEDIKSAQAALSQAKATLEQAKRDYERTKQLYEDNVASRQMYDAAQARYEIAQQGVKIASETLKKAKAGPTKQDIQVARARVREAEVGLEMAEQQLKDSTILAPFPGIIAEKFMNEGEIVSSVSLVEVIRLVDLDTVKIECAIPESEMGRVQTGAQATIEVDAYPGDQFPGNISTISPIVDPGSRTFKVTIEILNTNYRLKPGMFARVQLITEIHENTVLIPRSALTRVDGKDVVFVAENETAVLRDVTTGLKDDQSVEIIQGIQAGEQVIIEGNYGLEEGTTIKISGSEP